MLSKRVVLLVVALCCLFALTPSALFSQTATTGVVTGTVTDPTGALVAGANVTLQPAGGATVAQTAVTDGLGHYIFPVVAPGSYSVRVSAKGFRTAAINNVNVEVAKSATVDARLELGQGSEVVEVTASTGTELQTTDASIGETLGGTELSRLPSMARSSASLVLQMPGVAPDTGGGDITGGQIAGSRSEQVTFNIDGGDATSDLEGSNSYISPSNEPSAISPVVPIPLEATQEFDVATSNPNSTFGRSAGGQVSLLTKEGTNKFHGSVYEYHDDDGLNANGWSNDRLGLHKPHTVDNRFGAQVGGPILHDKLFFSGFYEGRRFYDNAQISRVVPTDTLKNGILQFQDCAKGFDLNTGACLGGNIVQYNFNPANGPVSSLCGATQNLQCDPRSGATGPLGVSPVIMSQLALYPAGNDTTLGDGLNTTGLTANVATPVLTNTGKLKLSFNMNKNWTGFVTYQLSKTDRVGTEQINILGTPKSGSGDPYYSAFYTFQIQGLLTPQFTAVTHGSFLRNWWAWARTSPTPLVSGTDSALQISGEGRGDSNSLSKLIADPVNINTQQARSRIWDGHDWYIAEDMSLIKGSHTFQFGGAGYLYHDFHLRTDDVLGGLTTAPIYYIGSRGQSSNSRVTIGSSFRPPSCDSSASISSDCLSSGADVTRWNGLYASLLGLLDHSSQIQTRDGNFNPNPLGTALFDNVTIPAFTTYFQDVWKVSRDLTITAGLNWGSQLTPSEQRGKEVVLTYADTNTPVNYQEFLRNRQTLLGAGQLYNPLFGLVPVNHLPGPLQGQMRVTDWTDVGPRIAAAWQVPFKNKLFGDRQTVIRGGYALVYDRSSAVNQVLSPLLTGGLADVDQCLGPTTTNPGGGPGALAACSGARTSPVSAYRIGVDGNGVGVPAPAVKPIPFVPGTFGLVLSAPLDPYATPGKAHSVDFTVQRALSHNYFIELGYIGRFSRNLPQGQALTSPYYNMKDPGGSGQTYAQAFDNVACVLRGQGGKTIGNFTCPATITAQPFFENVIGSANCVAQGFANCSLMEASFDAGDLINGDLNSFGNFELDFDAPQSLDNIQIEEFAGVTDHGYSDYNAGFLKFRKSYSHGLQYSFDWTWSHAIGNGGTNQQYLVSSNSPYNINLDRASEVFDHRHVLHAFVYYDLPFGKGRAYASGNSVADRIIGGWHTAGIWTYYSGAPACVLADGDYGSFFNETCAVAPGALSRAVHSGVAGSGGIGTAGGGSGSGLNFFADPQSVYNSLNYPIMSAFSRVPFDQLRALPFWNLDLSIGKNLAATERFKVVFTADAFNLINHVIFATPSLDLGVPANFGVINGQANAPRTMQLGLRFEF